MSWISCALWATMSDMTTQTRKDLVRTAASITAYAVIGTVTAGALYAMVWVMWAGAQAFWSQL